MGFESFIPRVIKPCRNKSQNTRPTLPLRQRLRAPAREIDAAVDADDPAEEWREIRFLRAVEMRRAV